MKKIKSLPILNSVSQCFRIVILNVVGVALRMQGLRRQVKNLLEVMEIPHFQRDSSLALLRLLQKQKPSAATFRMTSKMRIL